MNSAKLAELYMPLAESMARARSKSLPVNLTLDEVRSAAFYGLSDAASRYDPSKGVPFSCYAKIRISGEITELFRGTLYSCDAADSTDPEFSQAQCSVETEDFFEFVRSEVGDRDGKFLKMYYVDGKSLKEAGMALGVGESRASQILKECHKKLGRKLKKGVGI